MCEPSPCVSGTKLRRHRASADLGLAGCDLVVVWFQFLTKFSRLVFHTHPEGVLVSAFHPVFHVWSRILEHLCENEPKVKRLSRKISGICTGRVQTSGRQGSIYKTHKNEASVKVSWLSDRIMGWSVAAGDGLPGSLELGVFVPANLCMSEL